MVKEKYKTQKYLKGRSVAASRSKEKMKMVGAITSTPSPPQRQNLHSFSFLSPASLFDRCSLFGIRRLGLGMGISKCQERGLVVRACGDPSSYSFSIPPLRFESPVGQLLAQIMQAHPHLLPTTIDQQLENLQNERDEAPLSPHLLYKRIGEVKEKERHETLKEIIYSLIVQKFSDKGILMIQKIPPTGLDQEQKLKSVHSSEAYELVERHLSHELGGIDPLGTNLHMSKTYLGFMYSRSILHGYFVRRVDEHFEGKLDNWILYVNHMDAETRRKYISTRSKEGMLLLDKQTQALFGWVDVETLEDGSVMIDGSNDEFIPITFKGMTMLVLEAEAFGSFLWDAETYVDSKYRFLNR